MEHPKLRDLKRLQTRVPYPINEIPEEIIKRIGKNFIYMLCVGRKDLTGDAIRTSILVRSNDLLTYTLFEEENHRYVANQYRWEENRNGNLVGIDIETGDTCFTWQPHGSQFTIHTRVPRNAVKFKIKQPPKLDVEETLRQIKYSDDWVEIL